MIAGHIISSKNKLEPKRARGRVSVSCVVILFLTLILVCPAAKSQTVQAPTDYHGSIKEVPYGIDGTLTPLINLKIPNLALPWFNAGVAHSNPLASCSVVIELSPGRTEDIFAGNCTTKNHGESVQVCQDTGVGEAKLIPIQAKDATDKSIWSFLIKYCPGG